MRGRGERESSKQNVEIRGDVVHKEARQQNAEGA
jgi:hypothetical protein